MTNQYLKNMFNMMKDLGKFSQYETYKDFKRAKYGNILSLEEWQEEEGFTDKDKKDWDYLWGESY